MRQGKEHGNNDADDEGGEDHVLDAAGPVDNKNADWGGNL